MLQTYQGLCSGFLRLIDHSRNPKTIITRKETPIISASRMAAKPCAHLLLYNPLQAFATMWVLSRERHSLKIMSSEIPGNLLLVSSTEQDRLTHARNLLLLSFFLDQRCIVSLRTHDTWDKSFSKVQDIISTLSWINPSNAGAAHIDPNVVVSPKS